MIHIKKFNENFNHQNITSKIEISVEVISGGRTPEEDIEIINYFKSIL